jgi:hypothetical protein
MQVICLEDGAFYALIDKVIAHIKNIYSISEDRWISVLKLPQKLYRCKLKFNL